MYTNTRTTSTRLRNRSLQMYTTHHNSRKARKIQLTTTAARLRKIDPTTAKMSASPALQALKYIHVAAVFKTSWYYVLHYTTCNGIVYYTTRSSYHQRLQVVTKSSMAGKHIPSSMCLRTLHLYLVNILA